MSALLNACGTDDVSLSVRVVSGLAPEVEFQILETTLFAGHGASNARVLATSEARASARRDYGHGVNVASYRVAPGSYRVRVRLLQAHGALTVERVIAAEVATDSVLTVHLTRDCVGVVCPAPAGSALLSTCFSGQCVDPRCSPSAREYCPEIDFCANDDACSDTSPCSTSRCIDGVCTPVVDAGSCADEDWCNPDLASGCQPRVVLTGVGVACGTICTVADEPCQFGYWNCSDRSDPFCDALSNRPLGFVCGTSLVCDQAGECGPDHSTILVEPTTGLVTSEDGMTASFTVVLREPPTADVTIGLSTSDNTEGGQSSASLRFTVADWSAPQTVVVTGVNDGDSDGDVFYRIVTAPAVSADPNYDGVDAADVELLNRDDDTAGTIFSRVNDLTTTEGGASDSFTVRLRNAPSADVHIALTTDSPLEVAVAPSELVFTPSNFAVRQTVTVTGVDDVVADGDVSFTIVTGATTSTDPRYNEVAVADVLGVNHDNDTAGLGVAPRTGLSTSESGATSSISVVLNTPPIADVELSVTSTNPSEGTASPSTLHFDSANWDEPQSVTLQGVDDFVDDGAKAFNVIVHVQATTDTAYQVLADVVVPVTNFDDDASGVIVSPTSGLVTTEAGGTATTSIVLGSQPTADVSIALASSNIQEGTVTPSSITFTAANWNTPQVVLLTGVNDGYFDADAIYELVTSDAASSDETYNGLDIPDVSVTNRSSASQQSYIKATMPEANALFGVALALSGDGNTLAVGASGEDVSGLGAGGIYVFVRSGAVWTFQARVVGLHTEFADGFGSAIALSFDGNRMAATAPGESSCATGVGGDELDNACFGDGAAYVFVRSSGSWTQEAYFKPAVSGLDEIEYGSAVALSADGHTLAVGCARDNSTGTGIDADPTPWPEDFTAGAAYVYERVLGSWSRQAYIKASNTDGGDYFGLSLALSGDGNSLVVGASQESSAATGIGGDQLSNSAPVSGAVYEFIRSAGSWSQHAYIKASNTDAGDGFGAYVDLSGDGQTLVVAAIGEQSNATGVNGNQSNDSADGAGAVYVFRRVAGVFAQEAYIKASNTRTNLAFGSDVSISADGNALVVGAGNEQGCGSGIGLDSTSSTCVGTGAAYVFSRIAGVWAQHAFVKSAVPDLSDRFGQQLCMSADGSTIAVGAAGEDSSASGVGGAESSNATMESGAVYVFEND